jgi:hypothetical protein
VPNVPVGLVESHPEIQARWEALVQSGDVLDGEPYNAMSVLARVVVELQLTAPPAAAFLAALERSLQAADSALRNLLIVGLIEDIQNGLLKDGVDLTDWERELGPSTRVAWAAVAAMWSGTLPPADFNRLVDG